MRTWLGQSEGVHEAGATAGRSLRAEPKGEQIMRAYVFIDAENHFLRSMKAAERVLGTPRAAEAIAKAGDLLIPGVQAFPLTDPMPVPEPEQGYADVGIRLAFTAPAESVAESLSYLLAKAFRLPRE